MFPFITRDSGIQSRTAASVRLVLLFSATVSIVSPIAGFASLIIATLIANPMEHFAAALRSRMLSPVAPNCGRSGQ